MTRKREAHFESARYPVPKLERLPILEESLGQRLHFRFVVHLGAQLDGSLDLGRLDLVARHQGPLGEDLQRLVAGTSARSRVRGGKGRRTNGFEYRNVLGVFLEDVTHLCEPVKAQEMSLDLLVSRHLSYHSSGQFRSLPSGDDIRGRTLIRKRSFSRMRLVVSAWRTADATFDTSSISIGLRSGCRGFRGSRMSTRQGETKREKGDER